jgi:chromosomal replication initiation ATPase DnaA
MYLNSAIVFEISPISALYEKNIDSQDRFIQGPVIRSVCRYFGIDERVLREEARKTDEYVLPKQIAIYLLCRNSPLSLAAIGRIFSSKTKRGHMDHTNVVHARGVIQDRMKNEPPIAAIVTDIEKELNLCVKPTKKN